MEQASPRIILFFLAGIFLFITGCSLRRMQPDDFNISEFKDLPADVRVHTWWHWLDGRITREGITKDLESMRQQGIVQATILNVSMFSGEDLEVEKVVFNTEKWYDMFRWALQEAARLGITLGVHNCDGWSSSGGPWITPGTSMKKFVFTKKRVPDGQTGIRIPRPLCESGFYRDVAVLAFRSKALGASSPSPVRILVNDTIDGTALSDGNPQSMIEIRKNTGIVVAYPDEVIMSRIAALHNFKGAFYFPGPKRIRYSLSASSDGKSYRKITDFETNRFYSTEFVNFPETKARFFRVEVSGIFNLRPWHHAALAELQLLGEREQPAYNPSVRYPLEKTASARILDPEVLYMTNVEIDPDRIIPRDSVINLTGKMTADGMLDWKVLGGNWSVIRFGYTTTGAENGPATAEGRGLECDKMDTSAVNLHFRNFPQKLIDHAGEFIGNTFRFLLIDSWERGYQTWTQSMQDEFEKRRGYDLLQWIPVLCGETVGSTELSEGFLYDFRKTAGELIEENYYRHFRDLCHRNGLELHGEVIYGDIGPFPPIDVLRTNTYMDMPMYEFWSEQNQENLVEYNPSATLFVNFPAHTANFYNTPVIGAEAYTGYAHYSESPADLKLFGDKAYCSGMNQMILHSYVHQPVDLQPGLTLGQHGSHFNRNNPAWKYAKGWTDYQSRIQYILQKGVRSAAILWFTGDQFPQFFENKTIQSLPAGYQVVPCNADIMEKLRVKDGRLIYGDGQEYRMLVLPDRKVMEYSTLQTIASLIHEGAVVYGDKPEHLFSLSGMRNKEKFRELAARVWSGCELKGNTRSRYGKGLVIRDEPIEGVLPGLGVVPDFTTGRPDTLNLMFIHKQTANADVYFVVNQQDSALSRDCLFSTRRKRAEIWDPMTGEVRPVAAIPLQNDQMRIALTFRPRESLFFIFRDREQAVSASLREPALSEPGVPDLRQEPALPESVTSQAKSELSEPGSPVSQAAEPALPSPGTVVISDLKGRIVLHPINEGKTDTIEISGLQSLTGFDDPQVKYFAGEAEYLIDFDLTEGFAEGDDPIWLDLGALDATAEVRLNGVLLADVWMPGTRIPAGKLLKERNHLEVRVATTCRNRIIGDLTLYGKFQSGWTSAPVAGFLPKGSSLKPTGLIGPLTLVKRDDVQKP